MNPRTASSQRHTSSSIRSPSPSNGSSRTSITMMPQSVRCSLTHTENKSITPSEKACLLVSRRRQCPSKTGQPFDETVPKSNDRTVQPVVETGQEQHIEHTQIMTLLDRQRDQILADCQAEVRRHEFQANYDRRIFQKLSETIESQQEERHLKQKNFIDEINNFFMNSY